MSSRPQLSARLDGNDLVASTDDGRTTRLDLTDYPHLREAFYRLERATRQTGKTGSVGEPTAAALASVAEAAHLRPEIDDAPPRHPITAVTTSGPRVALGSRAHAAPTRALRDVLARRCSRRSLRRASITDLAPLLVRAGRTRAAVDLVGGGQLESRPFPSAGARHPNELIVAAHGVDGLHNNWWWFEPFACTLIPLSLRPEPHHALATLAEVAAMDQTPTAAVFVIASFDRTLSRYPAGSTLVWRDAGAVLATVHLAATELGLASCIIGTSGIIQIPADNRYGPTVDVGAVAVGAQTCPS